MIQFGMFCKTYINDYARVKLMLESFNKFNRDGIQLVLSCPLNQIELFKCLEQVNINVITDESYASNYFTDDTYYGLSHGYINQEICKLAFWELGLYKNYLCVDSDVIFIRDFYIHDFMYDNDTPYTVLVMDKELKVEKYYSDFAKQRQNLIKRIYEAVGLIDARYRTHGMQIMSLLVLQSFKDEFMSKNALDYKKLIQISPYEFTWYNAWFQKIQLVKEFAVEPFFKTFHMKIEYNFARIKNLTIDDLKAEYVGIVMNSNWINQKSMYYKDPNIFFKIIYNLITLL